MRRHEVQCERGLTSACLTMNPGHAGAGYGYAEMGPYQGGKAEYLVVPYGDFNCLRLPEDAEEKDWEQLTTEEFLRGYHGSDDIYDDRPAR